MLTITTFVKRYQRLSSYVKPLIRFLKAWKYFQACAHFLILPGTADREVRETGKAPSSIRPT